MTTDKKTPARLSKDEIQTLREELPRGAMKEVAEETGYTYVYVRMILSGHGYNELVIEAALRKCEERREKVKSLRERILS